MCPSPQSWTAWLECWDGQRWSSTSSGWRSGQQVALGTASLCSLESSRAVSWVISKCLGSGARRRGLPSREAAVGPSPLLPKLPWCPCVTGVSSHNLEATRAKLDSWWVTGRTPPRGYFTGWRLKWPRDCVPRSESSGPWLDTSPLSSLVSSAPSSLRSLCGVGICREKSKTKMPTIKSQCFETQDSWRTEGLFLDMQVPLQFWCRGRDDALNRVLLVPLCRASH